MISYKKRISLLTFILTLVLLLSCLWTSTTNVAYAEGETVYSNVLNDLKSGENFSLDNYPVKYDDYSLKFIQVAESSDDELFVYIYQPASPHKELTATSVKMKAKFIDINDNGELIELNTYAEWGLELLSREGTLCKYIVKGYKVFSQDSVRSYEVVCLYRPFDASIDESMVNGNIVNYVACDVSAKVTFIRDNSTNMTNVFKTQLETIKVQQFFTGFSRYTGVNSFLLNRKDCDAHFIAFSTEQSIDKLLFAEVTFYTQAWSSNGITTTYAKEPVFHRESVEREQTVSVTTKRGFFSTVESTYSWNRIEDASTFLDNHKNVFSSGVFNKSTSSSYSQSSKEALESCQYVISFFETDYHYSEGTGILAIPKSSGTIVSEVQLLSLGFERNGDLVILGVVSNIQTGPKDPSVIIDTKVELSLEGLLNELKTFFGGLFEELFALFDFTWLYIALGVLALIYVAPLIVSLISLSTLSTRKRELKSIKSRKRK